MNQGPKIPQMPDVLYICDPTKNVKCDKVSCFLNNGPCYATRHIEYARQPVTEIRRRLMTPEEAMRRHQNGAI